MFGKCSWEVMSRVHWPGICAGDTSPHWWRGQAALWRCNLFHLTPQGTAISFGSCIFLPSPKWLARSLSLPMNFSKLSLKPLSRGAAPPGALRVPHSMGNLRGRQEVRGNYLFLTLPLSKYAGEGMDGLASLPSGTAAAEFGTRLRAVATAWNTGWLSTGANSYSGSYLTNLEIIFPR